MIDWLIDKSFKYGQRQLVMENRPFPSPPGPPYQNEVKCSAFDMEMIFYSHASKTRFHKKGVHLASFWKWGFLELGSGLFSRGRFGAYPKNEKFRMNNDYLCKTRQEQYQGF